VLGCLFQQCPRRVRVSDRCLRAETEDLIPSIGHSTTRPVIRCSSTLCLDSRNVKYAVSACDRASRVPLGEFRSTFPKDVSASAGSTSHSGRPNHVRTCSRWPTSPRMVPSVSPADARASTNPASASVSNGSSSSAETGAAHRGGPAGPPVPPTRAPSPSPGPQNRSDEMRTLQESRSCLTWWESNTKEEEPLATGLGTQQSPGELTGCRTVRPGRAEAGPAAADGHRVGDPPRSRAQHTEAQHTEGEAPFRCWVPVTRRAAGTWLRGRRTGRPWPSG
jgi:hypothetical protein